VNTVGINQQGQQDAAAAAEDHHALGAERQIWTKFAEANNVEEYCQSWLAIQCRLISGVAGGLVLLGPPDQGPFTPVAVWPDIRKDMQYLTEAAQRSLTERRGLLIKVPSTDQPDEGKTHYHIAYPIEINKLLYGVVVLDVVSRPQSQLQAALRQLHWGSAWLETLFRRKDAERDAQAQQRIITALDLVAGVIDNQDFNSAAINFVTELATKLDCHRVSIGFLKKNHIAVKALSHSSHFNEKSNLTRTIGSAMDEAYDQKNILIYPEKQGETQFVRRAHEELAALIDDAAICSIPIIENDTIIGVVTLERSGKTPFDTQTVELCESIVSLAGPVLEGKRKNDQSLIQKVRDSLTKQYHKFIGPREVAYKIIATSVLLLLLFFIFAKGDYRITATTVIEGKIQRVVTSPFAGYITEAKARAGDIVKNGQVLAILDDKDLRLEHFKLLGQKQQLASQYREAMAKHDRAQIRVTMAQMSQVQAQLDLVKYKLSRTKLIAPFSGVVVTGDLSQALGSPVEKGQVLFQIAPLDNYRIILQVDERDIAQINSGQNGILILSSLPDVEMLFYVEKITPVSTAQEGRNFFRVEAKMDQKIAQLRPGMEGVGKIMIDRKNLFWIWTHKIGDWFRLWFWSWTP